MSDARFLQDGFDKQLAHAMEECGEFVAAAAKTQRWGPLSTNPLIPEAERITNIQWVIDELGDLELTLQRLRVTIAEQFGVGKVW